MTIIRAVQGWPVKDEFLRGMEEMDRTKKVPFYAVFAAQIFLDITYTLGKDIDAPFYRLAKHGDVINNSIRSHFDFHSNLKISHWPASNDRWMRQIQAEIEWIGKDKLRDIQALYRHQQGLADIEEDQRILRMSPVLSGLVLYKFRDQHYEAGTAVANAWGSIQYPRHLYHALRTMKLLDKRWADMDVLVTAMGEESFYVGGEPPKTVDECFKKFCLQMGTSAATMIKNRRSNIPLASKAGLKDLKDCAPVLRNFRDRYVQDSGRVDMTPEYVDQIIELSGFEQENTDDGSFSLGQIDDPKKLQEKRRLRQQQESGKKQRKKAVEGGQMAPEKMVRSLVWALHAETLNFGFPYLLMHRHCWRLLRAVKDACDPLLRQIFSPAYMERESQLPWVVGWILMVAIKEGDLRPARAAAGVMEEFLKATGRFLVDEALEKLLR